MLQRPCTGPITKFGASARSPGVVPQQVITAQTGRLLQDPPYSVKLLLHDE